MPPHRRLRWRWVLWLLLASDLLFTTVAVMTAYWLRFHWSSVAGLEPRAPNFPFWMMLPFGATFLAAFGLAGLYRCENVISGLDEYGRVFAASAMTVLLVIVIGYLATFPSMSRGFVLLSLGLVTFWVCLGRFASRRLIYRAASRGRFLETVVIVGVNDQAIDVARQLNRNPSTSTRVIGFLSDYRPRGSAVADGLVVLGEPLELDRVARDVSANRAVVIESGLAWESLRAIVQVMHRRSDLAISLVPGMSNLHSTPMDARRIGAVLTLEPRSARITGAEAVMKRALDFAVVVPSLLLGLPLMVLMVAYASIQGQGTGLTSEEVMCPAGKLVLHHFRYPKWADRLHVSRLPELFLVLSGKMSLLGPRPVAVGKLAEYARVMALLESAKPGLIGPWWLVGMGRPEAVDAEVVYDLYYLQNYSLWLDLQLLVRIGRSLWQGQSRSAHVQVPHLQTAAESNPPSDLPG